MANPLPEQQEEDDLGFIEELSLLLKDNVFGRFVDSLQLEEGAPAMRNAVNVAMNPMFQPLGNPVPSAYFANLFRPADPGKPKETQTPIVRALMPDFSQDTSSPLGKLMLAADVMGSAGDVLKAVPIMAFHGTPHARALRKSGKFSADAIGTGEGAQSYGYGHYFAEHPEVAGSYSRGNNKVIAGLTEAEQDLIPPFMVDRLDRLPAERAEQLDVLIDHTENIRDQYKRGVAEGLGDPEEGLYLFEKMRDRALLLRRLRENPEAIQFKDAGMVHIRLNVEPEELLDWDAPLSEQPKRVQELVDKMYTEYAAPFRERGITPITKKPNTGEEIYQFVGGANWAGMGNAEMASRRFYKAGIPGLRYFDQGSRSAKEGTRNIVMFPGTEDLIEMLDDVRKAVPEDYSDVIAAARRGDEVVVTGYRGFGTEAVDSAGDDAMYGSAQYITNNRRAAEIFAEHRPGEKKVATETVTLRKPFTDEVYDDPVTKYHIDLYAKPEYQKLFKLMHDEGMPPAMIERLQDPTRSNGVFLEGSRWLAKKYGDKGSMWPGASRMRSLLEKAGFDGIVGRVRDQSDIPNFDQVVKFTSDSGG